MATTPATPEPTVKPAPKPGAQPPLLRLGRGVFIAFLLLLAAFAACEIAGWPFLRTPAERFLNDKLKRTVRLGEPFRLHLLGGIRLSVGSLYLSAPAGFASDHLIDASDASVKLRYRDLLSLKDTDPYRIEALHVGKLDAQLERHKDGTSTWQFKQDENDPSRPFPLIESLVVKSGTAAVIDPLTDVNLKLVFDTDEGTAEKQAQSNVQAKGSYRQHKLAAKVTTYGFLPIATQSADAPPVRSKGWVDYGGLHADFDGAISDLFGKQNIRGKLTAKGPSLSVLGDLVNTVLPTTEAFVIQGAIEKKDQIWEADISSARIAESDLAGKFIYNPRDGKPLLEGELRGKHFMLADLGPAFGTRNEDGSEAEPQEGHAIPDRPLDLPSLNQMDAHIKVNLGYVDLGSAFDRPISPLRANLTLENGKLSLSDILAHTADGTVTGLISVDAGALKNVDPKNGPKANTTQTDANQKNKQIPEGAIPVWKVDLGWKDIDLAKWLQVSKERKQQAESKGNKEPPAYVTGTLNGKTRLDGKGRSTAQLLGSLNGDISMYIHEGGLSHLIVEVLGLDIAQGIGVLIRGDQSLAMQCAVLDLKAENGVVTPKVAIVDTPVTLVLIDGSVNLATENLNLRLVAKPKNFSPFTVRSPIRVRGPFVSPTALPEAGPIAARAVGAVALAFINPLAAILPFLDKGSGKQTSCAEALAAYKK